VSAASAAGASAFVRDAIITAITATIARGAAPFFGSLAMAHFATVSKLATAPRISATVRSGMPRVKACMMRAWRRRRLRGGDPTVPRLASGSPFRSARTIPARRGRSVGALATRSECLAEKCSPYRRGLPPGSCAPRGNDWPAGSRRYGKARHEGLKHPIFRNFSRNSEIGKSCSKIIRVEHPYPTIRAPQRSSLVG